LLAELDGPAVVPDELTDANLTVGSAILLSVLACLGSAYFFGRAGSARLGAAQIGPESGAHRHRLPLAVGAAGMGYWEWDVTSGTAFWSQQMFELFGMQPTPDGLVEPNRWRSRITSESFAQLEEQIRSILKDGKPLDYEIEITRENTNETRVLRIYANMEDAINPTEPRLFGLTLDVTVERRAEQARQDAIERFRRAELRLARSNDLLATLSRVLSENRMTSSMADTCAQLLVLLLRASDAEFGFIGEVHADTDGNPYLKTHAITNIAWDEASKALFERQRLSGMEFRNLNTLFGAVMREEQVVISNDPSNDPRSGGLPHGHPPMSSFLGVPIRFGGVQIGMVGVANRPGGFDAALVTELEPLFSAYASIIHEIRIQKERERAEVQVRNLNRELVERAECLDLANRELHSKACELTRANEDLSAFAYVVSHDLKAPLRAISNLADWILTDCGASVSPTGQEYLTLLLARVKRMGGLIDGILSYSRAGRNAELRASVDLHHLILEIVKILQLPAGRQVLLECPLPVIWMEPVKAHQIFQNLIENAFKFMVKPEGTVRVRVTREEAGWHFVVADDGPGIEPRYLERIFGLFQTMAPRDQIESSGVGLAVVKRIIEGEGEGGRIWAESSLGQGASFHFLLPRREPTAAEKTVQAKNA